MSKIHRGPLSRVTKMASYTWQDTNFSMLAFLFFFWSFQSSIFFFFKDIINISYPAKLENIESQAK